MRMMLCPCGTGKSYADCCQPWHEGGWAANALLLMRSRYSAYARHLPDYIMRTTHPDNPNYQQDKTKWREEILLFCQNTRFNKLEILEFINGSQEAYVTFIAHLEQNNREVKLCEKSQFKLLDNHWLYSNFII